MSYTEMLPVYCITISRFRPFWNTKRSWTDFRPCGRW